MISSQSHSNRKLAANNILVIFYFFDFEKSTQPFCRKHNKKLNRETRGMKKKFFFILFSSSDFLHFFPSFYLSISF
jgi:hypothetical protein